MDQARSSPEVAAREILEARFVEADVLFLAGSVVTGQATPGSDLDLVVVFRQVDRAWRESFVHRGWPVEAFVHDEATLAYFFDCVDGPSGFPALPRMVAQGVAIPGETPASCALRARARALLAAGPHPLSTTEVDGFRYAITDLVDDLRSPRSFHEAVATGVRLYETLADFHLRSRSLWSARRKMIPRRLYEEDPVLAARFLAAFERLFAGSGADAVVALTEELLVPVGGPLFAGHRLDAPVSWRSA